MLTKPTFDSQGPTSYAPVVKAAIDIVEKSGGQFHILVIIADGQVGFIRTLITNDYINLKRVSLLEKLNIPS